MILKTNSDALSVNLLTGCVVFIERLTRLVMLVKHWLMIDAWIVCNNVNKSAVFKLLIEIDYHQFFCSSQKLYIYRLQSKC